MRVAIVNDLTLATETLRRLLAEMPGVQLAWTAVDGREAVEKARRDRPDLILMDMVMPVMDGAEATRRIMKETPCAIVVVTATVGGNAERVYDALSAGALDATETPTVGPSWTAAREMLERKIDQVRRLRGMPTDPCAPAAPTLPRTGALRAPTSPAPAASPAPRPTSPGGAAPSGSPRASDLRLVAIGASTGGPAALATILSCLPRDFPFAIVVVQHLEAGFVPGLIDWLERETGRRVEIAVPGGAARRGVCSIASGDGHLLLTRGARFERSLEPADSIHRPAVDVLFTSLASAGCEPFAAVLLTGMGRDGAEGLGALRRAGWTTIAQDQATSVVWGMPGTAVRAGAAMRTLALDAIAAELMRLAAADGRERMNA